MTTKGRKPASLGALLLGLSAMIGTIVEAALAELQIAGLPGPGQMSAERAQNL